MKLTVFGTSVCDWIEEQLSNHTENQLHTVGLELLQDLPGGAETTIKASLLQKKAKRLSHIIPKNTPIPSLSNNVSAIYEKLSSYLNVRSGQNSFYIHTPNTPFARLLPAKDFLKELYEMIPEMEIQLNKLETTLLILKKTGFKAFEPDWLSLSATIQKRLYQQGFSPAHFRHTTQLSLSLEPLAHFKNNRLEGIGMLKELASLEIKGEISTETEFNELAALPQLQALKIGKGPKCRWPKEHLSIKDLPALRQLTIEHANRTEDYNVIFSLENLKEVTLMDFDPQNLKDIITIRSLERLRKINIHFSTGFELSNCTNPLVRNLIKHYQEYTSIKLFPAAIPYE